MTVKELIEILSRFNPNLNVYIYDHDSDSFSPPEPEKKLNEFFYGIGPEKNEEYVVL